VNRSEFLAGQWIPFLAQVVSPLRALLVPCVRANLKQPFPGSRPGCAQAFRAAGTIVGGPRRAVERARRARRDSGGRGALRAHRGILRCGSPATPAPVDCFNRGGRWSFSSSPYVGFPIPCWDNHGARRPSAGRVKSEVTS
jgi:hypothetical protein